MGTDPRSIMQKVDEYVDKHLLPKVEPVREQATILVIGDDMTESVRLATALNLANKDTPIQTVVLAPKERERVLVVDRMSISKMLSRAILDLAESIAPPLEPTCTVEPSSEQPIVEKKTYTKAQTKFKAFQNQQFNKGPTSRQRHAMVRPPRRGGR